MLKLKQSLVTFFGLITLVGLISLLTPLASRGQDNSDNAPPARDVNVVNTPAVNIVNPEASPALVRDVDRAAAQPYQDSVSVEIPNGEGFESGALSIVPAGKRLVVEYVTAEANMDGNQMVKVSLVVGNVRYNLLMIPQGTFGIGVHRSFLVASEPVRIYVDGGTSVGVAAERNAFIGGALVTFSISGHLVNAP